MVTPFHNGRPAHDRLTIPGLALPEMRFVYRARVSRIVDGDTLDVIIDQGMHCRRIERVRLLGINTPEVKGVTRYAGESAADWVVDWLADRTIVDSKRVEWPLVIQTEKDDAFGRYLAHVWCAKSGEYLNKAIIDAGHAVPYDG